EGIEFMIVAARATEGHAEHRRADDVSHLGKYFVAAAGDLLVSGVLAQRSQAVEAGGDQVFILLRRDLVAGELLEQEAVVGLVIVEGADDVISITPSLGAVRVVLETIGLGKADDIQPVLAPTLPIMRACQEALDQF